MTDTTEAQAPTDATGAEDHSWAIVEIMGHRRHAGRIREEERFGAKMLRIDIPTNGDYAQGFTTHYYGGSSIFSITPTDLATVARINKPYEPARLYSPPAARDADDDGGRDDGTDDDQQY